MYLDGIVFFLVKVVELIFGINVLRNSEKRYNYVAIYYGSISGLMVGYLFRKGIVLCLIVSLIVTLGLLSIRKVVDNGEDIIVLMILLGGYSVIKLIIFSFSYSLNSILKCFNFYFCPCPIWIWLTRNISCYYISIIYIIYII